MKLAGIPIKDSEMDGGDSVDYKKASLSTLDPDRALAAKQEHGLAIGYLTQGQDHDRHYGN
ncbi:hypothetical protein [Agrobacterium vitis]|uniref:hypothetical protein n=1 Tax=Agrobacterium vitis TaxID=373 RepID=UPI0015728D80|nr:hypothetical protein [Agrobacterium vitis]NSZ20121.1 hypothetical protein [Agrobacterium vitis]QZO07430.1 hypothetical protein K4831_26340 [Agrobacterium vitis]UJL90923.1 hypothetical protein AVF2S5_23350 [Agrobacterium vitis]BCH62073.1 hypothetical protein RvVAR0630_pl02150 [Agrobacterium vitis]